MKYQCDNCAAVLTADQLMTINRFWERVDEGGPEPDGECPHCGCLAYEVEAAQ